MNKKYKIRWLLDHQPVELFRRTAVAFDEEIQRLTDGAIKVEMLTTEEYAEKYNRSKKSINPMLLLDEGGVEISQLQTAWIGYWYSPDFFALEMPYLFKDHEHATRVLDGPIGKKLLEMPEQNSLTKGLAFTYSGGYRLFASNKPISTAGDLEGLNCVTYYNPVRVDTAEAFGCNTIKMHIADREGTAEAFKNGDSLETTLPRYINDAYGLGFNYIGQTNHNMYLTTILVNKSFFSQLTSEHQEAMVQAAKAVAVLERKWSVEDAENLAKDTESHDTMKIVYTQFSEEEILKLKKKSAHLYDKYRNIFSSKLIDDILNA